MMKVILDEINYTKKILGQKNNFLEKLDTIIKLNSSNKLTLNSFNKEPYQLTISTKFKHEFMDKKDYRLVFKKINESICYGIVSLEDYDNIINNVEKKYFTTTQITFDHKKSRDLYYRNYKEKKMIKYTIEHSPTIFIDGKYYKSTPIFKPLSAEVMKEYKVEKKTEYTEEEKAKLKILNRLSENYLVLKLTFNITGGSPHFLLNDIVTGKHTSFELIETEKGYEKQKTVFESNVIDEDKLNYIKNVYYYRGKSQP